MDQADPRHRGRAMATYSMSWQLGAGGGALMDLAPHGLDLTDFLVGDRCVMGKIEAGALGINQRPLLLYVRTQHLTQCLVHANRYAQSGRLDLEAANGAGTCEVVEHLDTEDQMASPPLTDLEHLPVAKTVRLLEAQGEVTRVLSR